MRQTPFSRLNHAHQPSEQAVPRDAAPVAWRPEVDERFTPDRYTSKEAALRAFARHVEPLAYQVLGEDPSENAKPAQIEVYADLSDEAGPIVDSLLTAFPEADVAHVATRKSRSDENEIDGERIYIEVEKRLDEITAASWDPTQQAASGSFEVRVFGPHGDAQTNLRFMEKPWVMNFEEYHQNHPTQLLILSPALEPDRRDAERQSAELAVKALEPIVKDKLLFDQLKSGVTSDLREAVGKGTFVRDQFAQQLRRKNITVWRHAMLIDSKDWKPFVASALAKHRTREKVVRAEQRVTRQRRSFRFGGLIAMFASICGIYWVLDTLTKGYFTGRVAVIVAVFGIVGLMLILLVS
jgi:hypothetical protein